MTEGSNVTIWFLCGIILSVYGVTIVGSGIYNILNPPAVFGAGLHLDFWWGLVMLGAGLVFVFHQWPGRIARKARQSS